ncbi:hypothetical protein [Streptomyces sp. NPDC058092]
MGTSTPGSLSATMDAGVFGSAVNSGGTDKVTGVFSHRSLG